MKLQLDAPISREWTFRPRIGSETLSALVALYLVLILNATFWSKVHNYLGAYPVMVFALYAAIFTLFVALMLLFSAKYLTKPAFIFFILSAAVASWFTDTFGVYIDRDMIRNAVETTPAEAGHLITRGFVLHMLLYGLVPVLLILWVRIVHKPILQKLLYNTVLFVCCLGVFGATGYTYSRIVVATIRQHRDVVRTLNPVTPIIETTKYFLQASAEANIVVQPLGEDAKVASPVGGTHKPRVAIIVAGETARAANFSLGGYKRVTNPELASQDIVYFPNATSCGTATGTSLPCMFSNLTRRGYTHSKARENETLLDVLAHAGIDVEWWDNNTGSKGIADRVRYVDMANSTDPRFCAEGECQDGLFLDKLDKWLDGINKDSVLVLHQLGSHGPSYYRRYPDEFRRFTPDCRTSELGNCHDEEIVNAYDNSILYTDHVLATIITKLKARSDHLATGMIYVSDHGESLGENGLYLHGTPYVLAPTVQTHVPLLVWTDPGFAASMWLDKACLASTAAEPRSHDNLFHSVLSMMNVTTSVYDHNLDLFAECKSGKTSFVADGK
ncbi:phosphoethanolamine--lipid A transferase [Rhizobium sp. BK251]|uniref:phosphoethanolamine transferase n=1 Tax=Rhizobium sp. BK251 TaxID=2512125 RepID=UPI0010E242B3|nr:phosphoethanolamine--lipid A transferase [Rhizobium sp. BK251]TCL69835.1 phosphatidylethanolamine:Kdo2-lipid A phosphoethanolamine transferase [Rhizobium sp. BK251]